LSELGNAHLSRFANNKPVADLYCGVCKEEFELKSQKSQFRSRIADGAYRSMCKRLESQNNPNLLLLNYAVDSGVNNLFVVPKHFFVKDIIERRKPSQTQHAERAGSDATSYFHRSPTLERYSLCETVLFSTDRAFSTNGNERYSSASRAPRHVDGFSMFSIAWKE
jgi:hypothetical protein